jgi:6-pyruvoyltetrahydropterin/6-carboxytetrahydropterin synthase
MQIYKSFTFDSAHFLPNVPDGHKCKNIHGHTYHLKVIIEGNLENRLEWVMDFAELKKVIKPIVDQLDHQLINDIPGLENPTCERIGVWIWDKIKPQIPQLKRIELQETPTSGMIYEGE